MPWVFKANADQLVLQVLWVTLVPQVKLDHQDDKETRVQLGIQEYLAAQASMESPVATVKLVRQENVAQWGLLGPWVRPVPPVARAPSVSVAPRVNAALKVKVDRREFEEKSVRTVLLAGQGREAVSV